jgi:cobalt-precorrin 5A hydrolase
MGRKLSHHAMERDKMIIAGFGMRAEVTEASLQDALDQTGYAPDAIATVVDKVGINAFQAFARTQNLPIQAVSQVSLDQAQTQTQTQSQVSLYHRGTGSVAEAAALIAAGTGATLLSGRKISNDRLATCAIAITEG